MVAYGGIDCLRHRCHVQGRLCNEGQLPEDLKQECRCRLMVEVTKYLDLLKLPKLPPHRFLAPSV